MSSPISQPLNPYTAEPLAPLHPDSALDAAVDEISAALTQIEVILSDAGSNIPEGSVKLCTKRSSEPPAPHVPTAEFSDLPVEILLVIFAYASQTGEHWEALSLSLVCTQWRALLLADPHMWCHIALVVRDRDPYPTPPASTSALLRMARLTTLYLERSGTNMLSVTIKMPTRFRGLNANTPWQSHISVAAINTLQMHSELIKHLHLRVDHGLLHEFAYEQPCSLNIDSSHNVPCSITIPLPNLTSLSVDYISRNCFYFPFQALNNLNHLTLSNEGFSFFQKSVSRSMPDLDFPELTSFVISQSPSFSHLCRVMSVTNASPFIKQVVLNQMPSLVDLAISSHAISKAVFPEVSALKIVNSPDEFTAKFCRVFQFSALRSFELVYTPPKHATSSMSWTALAYDIVCFIRRCTAIQRVTVRNVHEHFYPNAELVRGMTFETGISPDVYIIGFPIYCSAEDDANEMLSATSIVEFLSGFEVRIHLKETNRTAFSYAPSDDESMVN
ncbi:hypothetical protein BDP27DRAFT_1396995 [Rhodocollybia butyracea]|uniref:F-box domain-containing protein n=1 Tax=Rhodocollybia butyracea TaxID=206335 RepID=A0A9P5Q617_9AGAR|nr:hypothetical protein BDP27DRAFT_1396995 [Rhodocollybia butyracea]